MHPWYLQNRCHSRPSQSMDGYTRPRYYSAGYETVLAWYVTTEKLSCLYALSMASLPCMIDAHLVAYSYVVYQQEIWCNAAQLSENLAQDRLPPINPQPNCNWLSSPQLQGMTVLHYTQKWKTWSEPTNPQMSRIKTPAGHEVEDMRWPSDRWKK